MLAAFQENVFAMPRLHSFCAAMAVAILISSLASAPAAAANTPIDCENTELESELLTCATQDFTAYQRALETLVRKAVKQLPASAQPIFTQAQQAWTAYRDADCAWNAYEIDTGVKSDLIEATCRADLTAARLDEIQAGVGPR